jgi:hypothetical protein
MDFDAQGRLVAIELAYGHVIRYDLAAETLEVVYQGISNSTALAVAPIDGGLYMGVNYPSRTGRGRIVRVEEDGVLTTVIDDLPPRVRKIAFSSDDLLYIAAQDPIESPDTILYTATLDGDKQEVLTYEGYPSALVVHPLTGELWGSEWNALWHLDGAGIRHSIPYSITSQTRPKPDLQLAITPDGAMYTRYTGPQGDIPVEMGIYRVDLSGPEPVNELVADISSINSCCVGGWITAGGDGNLYWIGDSDRFTENNIVTQHLLKITPEGKVTLIVDHVGLDPFSQACDPNSTDFYHTSGEGIWRIFEVDELYLPLMESHDT